MERIIVGYDGGYGNIKAVNGRDTIMFPSLISIGEWKKRAIIPGIANTDGYAPDRRFIMEYENKRVVFGVSAIKHSGTRQMSRGAENDFDIRYLLFSLGILSGKLEKVKAVVGIPFHYLLPDSRVKEVTEAISRREYNFTLIDQKSEEVLKKTVYIERAYPLRQGLTVVWDEFVKEVSFSGLKGELEKLLNEDTIVVDIGKGTTEFIVVSKGEVLESYCRSIPAGIFDIVDPLKQHLVKMGFGRASSLAIEDQIIKRGITVFLNGKIDVTSIYNEQRENLWSRIHAELTSILGVGEEEELFSTRNVIFAGGGSLFFEKEIKEFASERFDINVRPAQRRIFGNAYGARKLTQYLTFLEEKQQSSSYFLETGEKM